MNKFLLLLFISLLGISVSYGQSLKSINIPTGIINVDPIPNQGTAEEGEYKVYFKIVNLTGDSLPVVANRSVYNMAEGHGSFFCWDFCFDSTGNSSVDPVVLAPYDTTTFAQYIIFRPNGLNGYSEVTMDFINVNDGNDAISINYQFSVGGVMSIADKINPGLALSRPYPNPASNRVSIDYDLPAGIQEAQISIFNLIGQKMKTVDLEGINGTAEIETTGLRSGIYFLYLMVDGEDITSRKLVITK
ncbi:MAG: T9SS type A sorting domain-containing protein [Bacteroidetes bacterium]|nr:T9SS type A sorting domain-containing protein [Bacteroidota bacterium]